MGINWKQFELNVLRPTLGRLEPVFPHSRMAYRLVGETLFHESGGLTYLGQVPRQGHDPGEQDGIGYGAGIASIEHPTWDWMMDWLWNHNEHYRCISDIVGYSINFYNYDRLGGDLYLNVIMCRLRYWLAKPALPVEGDTELESIHARAFYWQKHYNGGQVDRRPAYIEHARQIPWE